MAGKEWKDVDSRQMMAWDGRVKFLIWTTI